MEKVHRLNKGNTFQVERESVACDDMFFAMSVTKVCDNPKCDYVNDKYIYECPKCRGNCVWVYLDTRVFCRHDHQEWSQELRKFR